MPLLGTAFGAVPEPCQAWGIPLENLVLKQLLTALRGMYRRGGRMSSENYKRLRFFNLLPQYVVEIRHSSFTFPMPEASRIGTFSLSLEYRFANRGATATGTPGTAQTGLEGGIRASRLRSTSRDQESRVQLGS